MNKKIISILSLSFLAFSGSLTVFSYSDEQLDSANDLALKWIINNHTIDPANYNLDDNVLRQEIAAVSRWVAWLPKKITCANIFSDISLTNPNSWACVNVEVLVDNNLIAKNATFRPEDNITKSEAIWMLIKAIWFDYNYDSTNSKWWQQQIVEYAVNKWVVESFTDYNTKATRWWIFNVANATIKKDEEIKKIIAEEKKYSDEVIKDIEDILWVFE